MPAGFELLGHAVERLHQFRQFIGGADIDAVIQLPFGDGFRPRRQRRDRAVDQLRKQQRKPGRSKQHHYRQQQQKSDVGPPKQFSFCGQFDVAMLAFLNLPGRLGEFWRQRHGDKHSAVPERRCRDNVVGLAPLEMRVLPAQGRLPTGNVPFMSIQGAGGIQAGGDVAIGQRDNESALQRREVFAKLFVRVQRNSRWPRLFEILPSAQWIGLLRPHSGPRNHRAEPTWRPCRRGLPRPVVKTTCRSSGSSAHTRTRTSQSPARTKAAG